MRFFGGRSRPVDEAVPDWSVLWAADVAKVESATYVFEAMAVDAAYSVRVLSPDGQQELVRLIGITIEGAPVPFSAIRLLLASATEFSFLIECSHSAMALRVEGQRGSSTLSLLLESPAGESPSGRLVVEIVPDVTVAPIQGMCENRGQVFQLAPANEPLTDGLSRLIWARAELTLLGAET